MVSNRVAVCLSGQPRFYDIAYECIHKNLIEPNNADVFIHMWSDVDMIGKTYEVSKTAMACRVEEGHVSEIQKLYKPERMLVQKQKAFNIPALKRRARTSNAATFSMFYSIWKANELKCEQEREDNILYDWVVRCRFDNKLETLIDLSKFDSKKLYAPNHLNGRTDAFPDQLNFSSSENMNVFSGIYHNVTDYIRQLERDGNENIVMYHLKQNKVPVERAPIKQSLIRKGNE